MRLIWIIIDVSHRIVSQGRAAQGQAGHFNCFKPARANRKSCRQLQQLQQWPKCWQLFCANARHGSQTQFSSYLAPTGYLLLPLSLFFSSSPCPLFYLLLFALMPCQRCLAATFYWLPTRRMMNIDAQRLINCK